MNRHERRAKAKGQQAEATISGVVDHALKGATDPHVVLGPLLWQPSDGAAARNWYFVIATCDSDGFRCDRICVPEDEREHRRAAVMLEFMQRKPRVIHDTDDEVYMARLCEQLWPGERVSRLRAAVESELAARKRPTADSTA